LKGSRCFSVFADVVVEVRDIPVKLNKKADVMTPSWLEGVPGRLKRL
jgi:hypothetical protein